MARINPITGQPLREAQQQDDNQYALEERTRRNPLTGRDVTYQVRVPRQIQQEIEVEQPDDIEWADYGRMVMSGGAQVAGGAGWLMRNLAPEGSTSEWVGQQIESLGNNAIDYWNEGLTDAAKAELAKSFVEKDEEGNWQWGDAGLRTAGLYGAQSLLGTAAGAGVGAGASRVLQVFANPAGRSALISTVRAGTGAPAGSAAAIRAAQAAKKLNFVDGVLAAAGFGVGEGLVGGMATGMNVEQEVRRLPLERLMESERFRQIYETSGDLMSEEERIQYATDTVAREASSAAGFQAGLTTALLGAPMGAYFGRFLDPVVRKLGTSKGASVLTGAAGEAAQEFLQSGAEGLITNRALIEAGDPRALFDDVLNQAVGGAAAGGLIGGGFGAALSGQPSESGQAKGERPAVNMDPLRNIGAEAIEAGVTPEELRPIVEDAVQPGRMFPAIKQIRDLINERTDELATAEAEVEAARPSQKKGGRTRKTSKPVEETVLPEDEVVEQTPIGEMVLAAEQDAATEPESAPEAPEEAVDQPAAEPEIVEEPSEVAAEPSVEAEQVQEGEKSTERYRKDDERRAELGIPTDSPPEMGEFSVGDSVKVGRSDGVIQRFITTKDGIQRALVAFQGKDGETSYEQYNDLDKLKKVEPPAPPSDDDVQDALQKAYRANELAGKAWQRNTQDSHLSDDENAKRQANADKRAGERDERVQEAIALLEQIDPEKARQMVSDLNDQMTERKGGKAQSQYGMPRGLARAVGIVTGPEGPADTEVGETFDKFFYSGVDRYEVVAKNDDRQVALVKTVDIDGDPDSYGAYGLFPYEADTWGTFIASVEEERPASVPKTPPKGQPVYASSEFMTREEAIAEFNKRLGISPPAGPEATPPSTPARAAGRGYSGPSGLTSKAEGETSPPEQGELLVDAEGNLNFTMDQEAFESVIDEWDSLMEGPPKGEKTIEKRAQEAGFIPNEEAQSRVDQWREDARAQLETEADLEQWERNSFKTILSLFDVTGNWVRPYAEAGYNVITFDIQTGQDVNDFSVEYFSDNYNIYDVYGILAACPCTDFASSGARWFKDKDADGRTDASVELVEQTLRTVEYFRPKFWALENPVGRIEKLTSLRKWRTAFQPHNFGDPYTKKTLLWGKFNADMPLANVEPTEGSKMHKLPPSEDRANLRSETPEGFAYAFFKANNFRDADPVQRTVDDFPEAAGAVREAMRAGITENEVRDLMETTYLNYEYQDARDALKRATEIKVGAAPTVAETAEDVSAQAHEAAASPENELPEPTEAQKEAGNYKKGRVNLSHLPTIMIENPEGSVRKGKGWERTMKGVHYGYFQGTEGADNVDDGTPREGVDVMVNAAEGATDESLPVFIINQSFDGKFDEHKVMVGFADEAAARKAYLDQYEKGWKGLGSIVQMTPEDFREWLKDPANTTRAALPKPVRKKAKPKKVEQPEAPPTQSLSGDNGEVAMYSRLGFFSPLAAAAEQLPQEKGSPKQMLAMLKKAPGVKAEELQWVGVEEFLNGYDGQVTKREIIDFVVGNGVRVDEVTISEETPDDGPYREEDREGNIWVYAREGSNPVFYEPDQYEEADQLLNELLTEYENTRGRPQYGKYTLEGGTNYREVLLTLPPSVETQGLSDKMIGQLDARLKRKGMAPLDDDQRFELAQGNTQALDLLDRIEDLGVIVGDMRDVIRSQSGTVYVSPHFTEPNVLLNLRLKDRTGPNGEKTLFVEEVQSDWHQEGRKRGYSRSAKSESALAAMAEELWPRALRAIQRNDLLGFETVADALQAIRESDDWQQRWDVPEPEDRRAIQNYVDVQIEQRREGAVLDAPFKNNAWVELGVKRVLRLAAEGNYDEVAWTTGIQQAERYDLAKQIGHINVNKGGDGRYNLLVGGTDGTPENPGTLFYDEAGLSEKGMRELIGSELTDRVLAGFETVGDDGEVELTGANLSIGGEGMKSFYDRTLRNVMQKQARKLDRSISVGVSNISRERFLPMRVQQGPSSYYAVQNNVSGKWFIYDSRTGSAYMRDGVPVAYSSQEEAEAAFPDNNDRRWGVAVDYNAGDPDEAPRYKLEAGYGVFRTQEGAQRRLDEMLERQQVDGQVWSVPITEQAKRKAMGGLPLFQRQAKGTGLKATSVQKKLQRAIDAVAPVLSVRVVQAVDEIPNNAVPSDVEGAFFNRGGVYLVADNLTENRIGPVFRHEVIGHAAVERHPDFNQWVDAIRKARLVPGTIQDLAAEVANKQGLQDPTTEAKEIIALMAERGIEHSLIDRIIAAFRKMLRSVGLLRDVSEAEIRVMLSQASMKLVNDAELAATAPHLMVGADATADEIMASIEALQPSDAIDETGLYSRPKVLGGRAVASDDIEAAMDRVMVTPQEDYTIKDRIRMSIRKLSDYQEGQMAQGILDSFHSIKMLEESLFGQALDATDSAYKAALATKNLPSVMAAILKRGAPELRDGAFQLVKGRTGVVEMFSPVTDHADGNLMAQWEFFAAANRASRLINETNEDGSPREKNFTQEDIDLGLSLEEKYPFFRDVLDQWVEFNGQILDAAEAAGIIDPESRKLWEQYDYVPFYRAMDEAGEDITGPGSAGGLEGQRSGIRRLMGGEEKLGSVFENMMMNTAHLIDASFKNLAMQRTTEMALESGAMEKLGPKWKHHKLDLKQLERRMERIGMDVDLTSEEAQQLQSVFLPSTPQGPDVVSAMWNGKPVFYRVNDPLLLSSVSSMGQENFSTMLKLFRGPKKWLTVGVTASPEFMLANLIRDTLSTWVISDVPHIPVVDSIKGMAATFQEDDTIMSIMMSGAGGGGFYDSTPEDVRKLMAQKVDRKTARGILGTVLSPSNAWRFWQKVGASTENATRVAIFRRVIEQGGSVAEAAYQARDVLNFSMHGDFESIKFLTQSVPFLNARLQGLYRLVRGYQDHPKVFAAKGLSLFVATLALLARNMDREEYEELPEWDKDVYWHVFLNERGTPVGAGDHWRIPKPFEIGSMFGTVWERTIRLAAGNDDLETFSKQMSTMMLETLAFNPLPQLAKPLVEQYANRVFFTRSPIVGLAESGLEPEAQYNAWTSETARLMAEAAPDVAPEWMRSPKRLEHAIRGYFGTLGVYALSTSDTMVRARYGYPSRPAQKIYDKPVVRRFLRDPEPRYTKYADALYDMQQEANALFSTINRYHEQGLEEKAKELATDNRDKLAVRKTLNRLVAAIRKINNQQRMVMYSTKLTPEEKREKLDDLTKRKNELMRQVAPFEELF